MKKFISLFLILVLAAGLTACLVDPVHPAIEPDTDVHGSTIPNINELPLTIPSLVVSDVAAPPTTTAPPPTTTSPQGTNPPKATKAPAAKLYPASALYKSVKARKFYMEMLITEFDSKGVKQDQYSAVRASDGDKQYIRSTKGGENFGLIKDKDSFTVMLPTGAVSELFEGNFASQVTRYVGRNSGLAIPMTDLMKEFGADEDIVSEFLPEMDDFFKSFDEDAFLNVGKFQNAGTAADANDKNKRYSVEVFRSGNRTIMVYFLEGKSDVVLIKAIQKDGSYVNMTITKLESTADAKYFRVPATYVKMDAKFFERFGSFLG